jgi:hypothetical protein
MLQYHITLTPEVSKVVDTIQHNIHDHTFQELPVNEQRNHIVDSMIRTVLEQVEDSDTIAMEVVNNV